MIIMLGPDHTGKTTLAAKLAADGGFPGFVHFTQHTNYTDFLTHTLPTIVGMNTDDTPIYDVKIFDRHIFCEYPYSKVLKRKPRFTLRQTHNLIHLILAHNPIIILCTHEPDIDKYDDDYLPFDKWIECLSLYRDYLDSHHIRYVEYDYEQRSLYYPKNRLSGLVEHTVYHPDEPSLLYELAAEHQYRVMSSRWWHDMYSTHSFATGDLVQPEILIVAERIGPNNMNYLPFETGPTGSMMADMLDKLNIPLGDVAITNYVKAGRRDDRKPNENDDQQLLNEINHIRPKRILLMGKVAAKAHRIISMHHPSIPTLELPHFGAYHHSGSKDLTQWYIAFSEFMGLSYMQNYELRLNYGRYSL